jgi:glycosyltransferase involved in cell wall biosynthesis
MTNRKDCGRKVLMIATEFPPSCGGGVQRSAKFVRYLPDCGWRPVVLTRDPQREGEPLLGARTPDRPGEVRIERVMRRNPFASLGKVAHRLSTSCMPLRVLALPLKYLWAPLPGDHTYWWSRKARRTALRLTEEEQPAVIYTSGPPHSVHLLGLWLKRRTGLPLVADFRDPWSLRPIWDPNGFSRRVDRFFELKVLRGADRVICNNWPMREKFSEIEPACAERCTVITNGFDPDDFEGLDHYAGRSEGPTRLAHVGQVTTRAAAPLLRALDALRRESPLTLARLELVFTGNLNADDAGLLADLGLDETVAMRSRVHHGEAIKTMVQADIGLLLLADTPGWGRCTPGKLYELMAAGRPVLAVIPDGVAADLVRESGIGLVVNPGDGAALKRALWLAAEGPEAFARKYYAPRAEVIARHERQRLTKDLARILGEVAEPDRPSGRELMP